MSQADNARSGYTSLQPSRAGGFSISPRRSRPASPGDIRNIRLPNYRGCAPATQAFLQQLRWGYCQEPSRSGTTPSAFPDWAVSFASDDHRFFLGVERPVPLAVGFPLSLWDAARAVVPVYCRQVVALVFVDVKGHRLYYLSIYITRFSFLSAGGSQSRRLLGRCIGLLHGSSSSSTSPFSMR